MSTQLDGFMERYLSAPQGSSPEQIVARIRHWIHVANHPEQFVNGDTSRYAISAKRRSARQNLRRLLKSYPAIAEQVMQEDSKSEDKK